MMTMAQRVASLWLSAATMADALMTTLLPTFAVLHSSSIWSGSMMTASHRVATLRLSAATMTDAMMTVLLTTFAVVHSVCTWLGAVMTAAHCAATSMLPDSLMPDSLMIVPMIYNLMPAITMMADVTFAMMLVASLSNTTTVTLFLVYVSFGPTIGSLMCFVPTSFGFGLIALIIVGFAILFADCRFFTFGVVMRRHVHTVSGWPIGVALHSWFWAESGTSGMTWPAWATLSFSDATTAMAIAVKTIVSFAIMLRTRR
ncbi:hypothetical protein SH528x_002237 [Novipirellula sp. SH528]|uniref:hypothetical protein n=1 Tax=Novipirellula sp. SH528 TaxID=3454466 RepID=UPI003F9FF227